VALVDDLVQRAHAAGTRTLLMVGGGAAREALLAATTDELRPTFVAALVAFARERQFDGLDLDWEPLPGADHDSFLALVADLRAAWPEAVLTAAAAHLPASRDSADRMYGRAAEHLDRLNVMTYSMAAAQGGWQSWHSAALYGEGPLTPTSIDHSVRGYLAAGVPPARLGIGIGFFGVCYTPPVDGPRQELRRSTIAAADCSMSYADIMRRYFDPAARRWDAEARVPYLALSAPTGPHGCGYVSYEDEQSIAERAAYVAERGLGGVIVWAVNEGFVKDAPAGERDPLMDALAEHFLGR
jgi:chitinase